MMQHVKLLALFVAFAISLTIPALAQDSGNQSNVLRIRLGGFRNDQGKVHCSIFNDKDPAAFPEHEDKWFKDAWTPTIKSASAEIDFSGLPPGKYAAVCYHDENSNGKFDQNALGIPKEGYCFSNNVKPRFSAPDFSQCAFDYKGGDQAISMTMIYY
jgi:uncharacterized protein (DUF2141 family)